MILSLDRLPQGMPEDQPLAGFALFNWVREPDIVILVDAGDEVEQFCGAFHGRVGGFLVLSTRRGIRPDDGPTWYRVDFWSGGRLSVVGFEFEEPLFSCVLWCRCQ